nr:hypothetical protein [Clostridium sp. OM04-12AA]
MLHISFGITAYILFITFILGCCLGALQTVPQSAWYPGSPSFPAAPTVTAAAMF